VIYWYNIPMVLTDEGYGPAVSGKSASLVGEQYLVVSNVPLDGYTPITDDEARTAAGETSYTTMRNNAEPLPTMHTVYVSTAELGRISTGDFTLDTPDVGFEVGDWMRLLEVVDAVETGAGLYRFVIDEVTVLDVVATLVFGMAIE